MNHCCRTCHHWDADRARDAAGRLRGDRMARCLWGDHIVTPASMRPYNGGLVYTSYMHGSGGTDCECWEARA